LLYVEGWEASMADGQALHVFQCGGGSPYGFTADRTGKNLPASECPDGWAFFRTLNSEPFDLPRVAVDVEKVHQDIAEKGFSIVHWAAAPG
jgi:hypothetical protein